MQPNDSRFDRATHRELAEETRTSLTERVRRKYTGQSRLSQCTKMRWPLFVATSNYSTRGRLHRRAPPVAETGNENTCTLVHVDFTDDMESMLALCHLLTSAGMRREHPQSL
jgi:hypothetical protein